MKPLTDILAEVQAIDTASLDAVVPGLAQVVTDLQAVIAAQTTVAATTVPLTQNLSDGTTATFFPPAA
jgi:hypothetical protein